MEKRYEVTVSNIFAKVSILLTYDFLSKLIIFAFTVLTIRKLTIYDYAAYSVFISVTSFLTGLLTNSIVMIFIKSESYYFSKHAKNSKLLIISLTTVTLLHFAIFTLVMFLSPTIVNLLKLDINYKFVIELAVVYNLIFSFRKLFDAYFQVKDNYHASGISELTRNLFILVTLLFFQYTEKLNIFVVIVVSIMAILISMISIGIKILKDDRSEESLGFVYIKEYINQSAWLFGFMLFLNLFNQLDILFISYFLGTEQVAYYGIAYRYYSLLLTLQVAINTVLRVTLSRHNVVDKIEEQKSFAHEWLKKSIIILTPICIIIIIIVPFIFPIINGARYNSSIPVFQVFCIGAMISYIFTPNVNLMISIGKYKQLFLLSLISSVFHISMCFFVIPQFGIIGAAIITVLAHVIINMGAFVFLHNRTSNGC